MTTRGGSDMVSSRGPREILADQLREVVLDAIRARQPDDWNPDDGVDEWTDGEYLALADAALSVLDVQPWHAMQAILRFAWFGRSIHMCYVGTHSPELRVVIGDGTPLQGDPSEVMAWLIQGAEHLGDPRSTDTFAYVGNANVSDRDLRADEPV